MARTPTSPLAAHHRLIKAMINMSHRKAGVKPTPADLDNISSVFRRSGGSWERVFLGSVDDMVLLKKVIKVAVKTEAVTKAPAWN